ncbi:MAG: CHAT domain-containing tetratricopeptide repeat protein [Bacteroidales bacterium]
MKKDIFIFLIVFSFFIDISYGSNRQKKNSGIVLSINPHFPILYIDPIKTPVLISDSLCQSIKKVYLEANKTYQNNNLTIALELYNQFINLAISQNYEKYLWLDIRMSLSHMSSITLTFFNYEKAIYYLKKALEITLKYNPNDFDNTFFFLFNIAKNYYNQYDYNNSLEYYHQAEALFFSTNSLPIINKTFLYNNIALCYLKLGSSFESQNYLNQSIEIKKSLGDFVDLAKNYNNIGLVFQKKAQYNEAIYYYNRSLFLYDSLKNQDRSAFIINNIGNLYLEKGSFDSCKYFYQKSLLIRQNATVLNYTDLIKSYNNLSIIYSRLNDLDSALLFNNLAIDLNIRKSETENQLNYYSISDYLISIADRIEINLKKYQITRNEKYLVESFALFHPTVKILIDQMIMYNSIFSTNIFVNENKRFFDYSILSSHFLDSINVTKCPRSLIISETYKSLSLINLQSEIRNLQYDSISFNQFKRLNIYYQWQQRLFIKEKSATETPKILLIDSLINCTLEIDLYKNQFLAVLKNNLYNYFNNLPDSILSNCIKLDDRLLLDYYIINNTIFIHTISKSNISCLVSPATKEFIEAVQRYPKSIRSLDQISIASLSKTLSLNLIDPLSDILKLFNNITIIPDENLTEIPFESLPYKKDNTIPIHYFVEIKNISYRFSILKRNYSNIRPIHKYSKDFFGIVPYEQNDSLFHNLNGSAREINDITNLFKTRNLNASSLVGSNATYLNFTNSNFDSRILHFSTHSFINNHSSNLSFLELFPVNNQFYLFLPVLSSIPFRNELLLLNACETGSNLIDSSTGFVSFIRSLSNISIQNYICTLWKIYDEPSYGFIMSFYENILKGLNYSSALTLAKRYFIQSDIYKYPLFWSPFILYENN